MNNTILVVSTAPLVEARRIAKTLVESKLVACVNLIPQVESYYRWKEEFCQDSEALLWMKTRFELLDSVMEKIKILHSYEVPEVIAFNIESGSQDYLEWILTQTTS